MRTILTLALSAGALLLGGCQSSPEASNFAAGERAGTAGAAHLAAEGDKRPDLWHWNVDRKGLAIEGYDPVAYFPEGGSKPRKGKSEISFVDRGITYRFASQQNLETFAKDPARFEPHYGGWCAYAMADGAKVEVDPKSYLIQNGRLMLFYKGFLNDTRKKWSKKPADYETRANRAWTEIVEPPK